MYRNEKATLEYISLKRRNKIGYLYKCFYRE